MPPISKLTVFILILLLPAATVLAQRTDSANIRIASLGKKTAPVLITKEPNIVFPDILKGNESATIDYIASFSDRRREYLIRMYNKSRKWFPKAGKILKKYNLPQELKMLLVLESAINADALSRAGAVGYWQIMDEVAKEYGLRYVPQLSEQEKKKLYRSDRKKADSLVKAIARAKDDRKDFNKSTQVAARYLHDRRRNLNDNWLLVVASYNCGVGNVWNAIEKSRNPRATFWDIKKWLPEETQAYVMNFITLNVVFNNYSKFLNRSLTFYPETVALPDDFEQHVNEELGTQP